MQEQPEEESKTEEPSSKKIQDAVDKGNVPFAREAPIFTSIVGIVIVVSFLSVDGGRRLAHLFARLIENPNIWSDPSSEDTVMLIYAVVSRIGEVMAPVAVVLLLAGLAGSLLQNPPSLVFERIKPKWSKLSLRQGWKRIFGRQGLVEFAKSLFKFALIATVCTFLLRAAQGDVLTAMFVDPLHVPRIVLNLSNQMLIAVASATLLLAVADIIWSRYHWRHQLRMTRQEVKDEHKQMDGDPFVKARLRSLAWDRQRRRMIAAVPRATVVVTNPTHYAVALRYVRDEGGAPMVVAKGRDLIALKIREVAAEHSIPIIEDKPLARSMYDSVEVDQMIPEEFYEAVAKLVFYLSQRAGTAYQTSN